MPPRLYIPIHRTQYFLVYLRFRDNPSDRITGPGVVVSLQYSYFFHCNIPGGSSAGFRSTGMERKAVDQTSGGTEEEAAVVVQQQPLLAGERTQIMKVMVAVDESEGSFYALKWTLNHFFHQLPAAGAVPPEEPGRESSMITIVHVQEPFQPFIYPAGPAVYATPMVVESVKRAQEKNAASVLSRALLMCKDYKIKAETLILEGDPKDRICEAAEELHVDLVVVGSRGLGKIKRAFLGSVSDYCAHHVRCPVLIVKPPRDQEVHKK
ncbi:uncharacterized protein [Coffea arabica]|uniref:UspA domain-containing protein n=1 Tax=Coffea arabica TaxID=13443 RepID=A0ABM4UMQ3_COFAR